jgi:TolB protein
MRLTLLLLLLFPLIAIGNEKRPNKEIFVELSTEKQLLPTYIAQWRTQRSLLPAAYLEKLRDILIFDIGHNGSNEVVETQKMAQLAAAEPVTGPYNGAEWRKLNLLYLVRVAVDGHTLQAVVYSIGNREVKRFEEITLTGSLDRDRGEIHTLADAIHRELFGVEGIAATRFLYTVRTEGATSADAVSEVWVADCDGSNKRQVTREGSLCVTPTFLPPNAGFASGSFFYVSYRMGVPKVYVASLQDGAGRRFSYLRGNQLMPAISAQRDQVAFISDAGGNPDLFLQKFSPDVGALGKPRQIFAAARGAQASPSFSPDGSRIAFVSNKDGSPRIYVMSIPPVGASSTELSPTLITRRNHGNTSPAWSPDGTKLAYSATTQGTRQIWVYDFDSGEESQVTQGPGHKENPTWAPNSLHLLYNSEGKLGSEIFMITLNQRTPVRVISGCDARFPSWEPR